MFFPSNSCHEAGLVQDAVPRSGKFWRLYSRPGHMCLINPQGDLIVRPSFVVRPRAARLSCKA